MKSTQKDEEPIFINASHGDPGLKNWSFAWLEKISRLYYLNGQRLAVREDPRQWPTWQRRLEKQVEQVASQRDSQRERSWLAHVLLQELQRCLTAWITTGKHPVHHPDIPMDNNIAEQTVRGGFLGRKNYYGSASEWSAELTAFAGWDQ